MIMIAGSGTAARRTPRRLRLRDLGVRFLLAAAAVLAASSSSVAIAGGDSGGGGGGGALVLSQSAMELSHAAAELSWLAYLEDPAAAAAAASEAPASTSSSSASGTGGVGAAGWTGVRVLASGPDLAVVAARSGRCYAGFRGTRNAGGPGAVAGDWVQNLDVAPQQVCWTQEEQMEEGDASSSSSSPSYSSVCCTVRRGFYDAYRNGFRRELEAALQECARGCDDPGECVVLTGHSQGGAVAAVAALHLVDLNPYVITFGQPPAIDDPCPLVTSPRWFRYVNSRGAGADLGQGGSLESASGIFASASGGGGIAYDLVPFVPTLGTASHFGHMIVLGEDPATAVYGGLDAHITLGPRSLSPHAMSSSAAAPPGYLERIAAIRGHYDAEAPYPVRLSGYRAGSPCTADLECESRSCRRGSDGTSSSGSWILSSSRWKRCAGATACTDDAQCSDAGGRCDGGTCLPRLGSCQPCDEDEDCASGHCGRWNRRCASSAAGSGGLMDDLCYCATGAECLSGRCEGVAPRACQPRLASGAPCNEDNDCLSGACSWLFRCAGGGATSSSASSSRSVEALQGSAGASSPRGHGRNLKRGKAKVHVDDDADSHPAADHGDLGADDDASTESRPFTRQTLVEWCLAAAAAAALSAFVAAYCCTAAAGRRRAAYDEIPTQLTV